MAGAVQEAKIQNLTSRARLKRGRKCHWRTLLPGRAHLGYQRDPKDHEGRWILRRYVGKKYSITTLGLADDESAADGERILSFEQANANAMAQLNAPRGRISGLTVRQAMQQYVDHKKARGQSVADVMSRGTAHILPPLGDLVVAELTAEQLRRWLATMAASRAQFRPRTDSKTGHKKLNFKAEPETDEEVRKRRNSANRVLTMLKAILNHAFDEGHVANRDAWGRKLKPLDRAEAASVRYLTVAECKRLINVCDGEFRRLVIAALQTGCRYGELTRLQVADFNPDAGTVHIRRSKSGEPRHVILTSEGAAFFKQVCTGRAGDTLMFTRGARAWKAAEQGRPMREAVEQAKIKPTISFHGLRHSWASHAVMNGVPLMVVAKNLGHVDTRMTERVYGHLSPSFIVEAIRAGAPKFGFKPDRKVKALRE